MGIPPNGWFLLGKISWKRMITRDIGLWLIGNHHHIWQISWKSSGNVQLLVAPLDKGRVFFAFGIPHGLCSTVLFRARAYLVDHPTNRKWVSSPQLCQWTLPPQKSHLLTRVVGPTYDSWDEPPSMVCPEFRRVFSHILILKDMRKKYIQIASQRQCFFGISQTNNPKA